MCALAHTLTQNTQIHARAEEDDADYDTSQHRAHVRTRFCVRKYRRKKCTRPYSAVVTMLG